MSKGIVQEYMVKRGLCNECKEQSERDLNASMDKFSFYDSFCEDCREKYGVLRSFSEYLVKRLGEKREEHEEKGNKADDSWLWGKADGLKEAIELMRDRIESLFHRWLKGKAPKECETKLQPEAVVNGYHIWWCEVHERPLYQCREEKLKEKILEGRNDE